MCKFSKDFIRIMNNVFSVEHSSIKNQLHKNKKEDTYTYMGIYPYTKLRSFRIIDEALRLTNQNVKNASIKLSQNKMIKEDVLDFYYRNFYIPLHLEKVKSVHKRSEIMVFAVNIGVRKTTITKIVQEIVGAKIDGIWGNETLNKLNNFDDELFDKLFDDKEIEFYERLVKKHKRLAWALNGWYSRSKAI